MKKYLVLTVVVILIGLTALLYFNDDSSQSPIEAIQNVRTNVGMLIREVEMDKGKLLFFIRDLEDSQLISAEYVKKTWKGWKWGYGGVHSISEYIRYGEVKNTDHAWSYQYFPSTKGTKFESPFPMLYGIIKDDNIDSISIHSYSTGTNQRAKIIKVDDHLKLWYQLTTEEQGKKFTISAITSNNSIISTKEIDEGRSYGSTDIKIRNEE